MQSFLRKNVFFIFWLFAAGELLARIFNIPNAEYASKPMLLPVLIIAVLLLAKPSKPRLIIVTGLFFSFLGDVFLMFEEKNTLFFIIGLVCFLITHLFYCWYFLDIKKKGRSLLVKQPWLILLVLLYTGSLVWLLFPKLGDLTVPVVIYACILTAMLLCSLRVFHFTKASAKYFILTGTICFVVSDSLLAINKFYAVFSYAGFFIMLTYCLAQYFITKGFIKNNP